MFGCLGQNLFRQTLLQLSGVHHWSLLYIQVLVLYFGKSVCILVLCVKCFQLVVLFCLSITLLPLCRTCSNNISVVERCTRDKQLNVLEEELGSSCLISQKSICKSRLRSNEYNFKHHLSSSCKEPKKTALGNIVRTVASILPLSSNRYCNEMQHLFSDCCCSKCFWHECKCSAWLNMNLVGHLMQSP